MRKKRSFLLGWTIKSVSELPVESLLVAFDQGSGNEVRTRTDEVESGYLKSGVKTQPSWRSIP